MTVKKRLHTFEESKEKQKSTKNNNELCWQNLGRRKKRNQRCEKRRNKRLTVCSKTEKHSADGSTPNTWCVAVEVAEAVAQKRQRKLQRLRAVWSEPKSSENLLTKRGKGQQKEAGAGAEWSVPNFPKKKLLSKRWLMAISSHCGWVALSGNCGWVALSGHCGWAGPIGPADRWPMLRLFSYKSHFLFSIQEK